MSPPRKPKLLLIRPEIPNDDFTNKFSHPASDLASKAADFGWDVTELEGIDANRNRVVSEIGTVDPDFIIHYGHGERDKIFGQAYPNEAILECNSADENVDLLSTAIVSTVSCSSALGFGPAAVTANTSKKVFLGHIAPYGCEYLYWEYFKRAANAANIALLDGKSFEKAKDAGYDQYSTEINNVLSLPGLTKYAAALLLWIDRETLHIEGNKRAKAK